MVIILVSFMSVFAGRQARIMAGHSPYIEISSDDETLDTGKLYYLYCMFI